ncbi:MAG: hypothetical protein ACE5EU_03365 [Paracoccaceae bacterium]
MVRWNPAKGNRKAGTKPRSKTWRSNKMVIPRRLWIDRNGVEQAYYEDMRGSAKAEHDIHGHKVTSLFQKPRKGFSYGCTPEDVAAIFRMLPADDVLFIDIVAFRQPTRKQLLQSVWGRLIFHAEFEGVSGPCIMLEATKIGACARWGRRQRVDGTEELKRLREDGHELVEDRRGWTVVTTEESIRNTLLYRTLLHELGHAADYIDYDADPGGFADGWDAYWARPLREREDAAHRYASKISAELRHRGLIPFAKIDDASAARGTA